ncbi:MAG: hypothetical protein KatS3mg083_643 [Candidatus Dojkabacteria bacterium]|nr:MAG: hypothetical protein KatS3mg083_643 [Candidatus Dojkabacteria bacterium]
MRNYILYVFLLYSSVVLGQGYPVVNPSTITNGKVVVHSDNGVKGVRLDSLIGGGSGSTIDSSSVAVSKDSVFVHEGSNKYFSGRTDGRPVFNVKNYGAKGDGITNDVLAIQAAVAAINTNGGGTLYFPKGTYKIHTGMPGVDPAWISGGSNTWKVINVNTDGFHIELEDGAWLRVTTGWMDSNTAGSSVDTTLYFIHSGSARRDFKLNGGKITFETAPAAQCYNCSNGYAFGPYAVYNSVISNIEIDSFPIGGSLVGYTDSNGDQWTNIHFENVKVYNYGGSGHDNWWYIQGGNTFLNCHIESRRTYQSHCLYWGADRPDNKVIGCTFKGVNTSDKWPLHIYGQSGGDIRNIVIQGNHFANCKTGILMWKQNTTDSIRNVVIANNVFDSICNTFDIRRAVDIKLVGNVAAKCGTIPTSCSSCRNFENVDYQQGLTFTSGSIPFAGSNNLLKESSYLFYDETRNRLKLNKSSNDSLGARLSVRAVYIDQQRMGIAGYCNDWYWKGNNGVNRNQDFSLIGNGIFGVIGSANNPEWKWNYFPYISLTYPSVGVTGLARCNAGSEMAIGVLGFAQHNGGGGAGVPYGGMFISATDSLKTGAHGISMYGTYTLTTNARSPNFGGINTLYGSYIKIVNNDNDTDPGKSYGIYLENTGTAPTKYGMYEVSGVNNYFKGKLGLNNTSPTEQLDVTGNVKFSGALMPGGSAGTSGQVLTSQGAGSAPTWTTINIPNSLYTASGTLFSNLSTTLNNSWTTKYSNGNQAMTFIDGDGSVTLKGNTAGSKGTVRVEQGFVTVGNDSVLITVGKPAASDEIKVTDNRFVKKGMEYAADYSAGYTDRSLVDKGYVNNGTWVSDTIFFSSSDVINNNIGGVWQRQGNTVFFTYRFEVNWDNWGGLSGFGIKLPVPSNFTSDHDVQGTVNAYTSGSFSNGFTPAGQRWVSADVTNDRILLSTEALHNVIQTPPNNRYMFTITGSYQIK